ncbi:hypothetical protein ABMA28_011242 [Loxostege sticticalis]|uniref:BPTI/Kunitz inhibitor domain-containing protein n=1 Tax=Loxostege sticticalis TaxID=481309 RepID=A0ABD0S7T5_LOXSC
MKVLLLLCIIALLGTANSESSKCLQPVEPGRCFGNFERYAYTREGGCKKFTYGGCGANDNNFETEEQCRAACLVPR